MSRKVQHNKIYTPESWAKVDPLDKQLLSDFQDYLRSAGRSETTIAQYTNDIRMFFVWSVENLDGKPFHKITKRNVISFQNWLITNNKNSPARVRRIKATLSSLGNFIEQILDEDEEYAGYRNPIRKVPDPVNEPVLEKNILSEEEADRIVQLFMDRGEYEIATAFQLARCSGRRRAELARFEIGWFTDENIVFGTFYKTPVKVQTKGRGVLGKPLTLFILAKPFKPVLDKWIEQRKELGIESKWLFPKRGCPEEHVGNSTFDGWAKKIEKVSGTGFNFHCLRHLFTTGLVRAKIPDAVIQDIVGWNDPKLIRTYTDIDISETLGDYFKDGEIIQQTPGKLSDLG